MNPYIKKQYFLDKYAIIAPKRAKRPHGLEKSSQKTANCGFCPEGIEDDLLIKEYGKKGKTWDFAVLKNKYPVVSPEFKDSYGAQEVVIETPDHEMQFHEMNTERIKKYLKVMADRQNELLSNSRIKYVLEFKNHGATAGASLPHSHSQIIALPFIPHEYAMELESAEKNYIKTGKCPYCEIAVKEIKSERRISGDKYIGVFAPIAPTFPYEAWIMPLRHVSSLSKLSEKEHTSVAAALKLLASKATSFGLAYNFINSYAVSGKHQHFYIKFLPRGKEVWAGVELGSGIIINAVPPENSARFYRNS